MERPIEGGGGRRRGGEGIGVRAADVTHDVGGAVLLVVGVQDQQHIEGMFEQRIGLVLQLGRLPHHVQEVAGIGEVIVRIRERHPDRVAIGEGGDRGHLGDQPEDLQPSARGVDDVLRVGVKGGKRAHDADQDAHRMRVMVEAVDQLFDVLVQQGVMGDRIHPLAALGRVG